MKIFNILFGLLFIVGAALQYNDPDPYVWIPIYLYATFCCWLIIRGKYFTEYFVAGIIIFLTYSLYLFFTENGVLDWIRLHDAEGITGSMQASEPWIESTREFLGLMIIVLVLIIDYFYARKQLRAKVKGDF